MQNAVIAVPDTSVSPQRTSSLANAPITMVSGPAMISPSGRTAAPKATTAPSTKTGPRSDQRSRAGPPPSMTASAASSTPSRPSSTARPRGSIPGPMPPKVPMGRSAPCQKAKAATAITTSPLMKACCNHTGRGERDEPRLSALTTTLRPVPSSLMDSISPQDKVPVRSGARAHRGLARRFSEPQCGRCGAQAERVPRALIAEARHAMENAASPRGPGAFEFTRRVARR
jgi:hypothetical protein